MIICNSKLSSQIAASLPCKNLMVYFYNFVTQNNIMLKTTNSSVFMTVLTLFALILTGNFIFSRSVMAQKINKYQNSNDQNKPALFSKNQNKTEELISDRITYELFLRTVGEFNAKGLVEKAGLNDEEVEQVVHHARYLTKSLETYDEFLRKIDKNNLSPAEIKNKFGKIQTEINEIFDRRVNHFLPNSLTAEGIIKLKNFIETEVKNNIQIVLKPKYAKKDEVKYTKSSTKSFLETSDNLYLYSSTWQNGKEVFGAGTIIDQYQGKTNYQIKTIITSPSGRSYTSKSDWNNVILTHETELSIGVEKGDFTVYSEFSQTQGYYDENGNFIRSGSLYLGSSTSSVFVVPQVGAIAMRIFPTAGNNNKVKTFEANIQADISFSVGFPNTPVRINLNRLSNPDSVNYNLGATVTGGTVVENTGSRGVIVTPVPGDSVTLQWQVTFSNMSPEGTVIESVRIDPSQFGTAPNNTASVSPQEARLTFEFEKPDLPPGGGSLGGYECPPPNGGNGFYPGDNPQDPNYGYGCIPSPVLIDILGNGFALTNKENGVMFDFNGDGIAHKISWTAAGTDDAWLVLDRNGNGKIDSSLEMFGNHTYQLTSQERNGFLALAEYDKVENGGNGDGSIDNQDAVFNDLRLWQDINHNGISESSELYTLPTLNVAEFELDYKTSKKTGEFGNEFRYRAKVWSAKEKGNKKNKAGRWAWDVFLQLETPSS